ncbi:hypothetical protein QMK19_07030 [Streptomyces sp. H10-C2]|uniref:hypothetical protein n=1 Tax=unclassified Streptomyces TaxID=2593676 RepID=UPI0024B97AEB|nr:MULTISPECIES: hypothetical protein [unclassified Streptomyces]MDJ0341216.1 hypothetical protein [Streptomyces sp. PH10-H1]MDJ0369431.1 hypothetical protein [Streptomyces sp. H10-C2]
MSAARALLALLGMGAAVLMTGCSAANEPASAGPTHAASAPVKLWPNRPPATEPSVESGAERPIPVPGMPKVASGDIRTVDPVAVVKAELAAAPKVVTGPDALDENTAVKAAACAAGAAGHKGCPIRTVEYYDLTGDGKADAIIGIDMVDGFLSLRCYTLSGGVLTRILATVAKPMSVQVAGGDLVVQEPTPSEGYEQRTVYAWDPKERAMAIQSDNYRRSTTPPGSGGGTGGGASASPRKRS